MAKDLDTPSLRGTLFQQRVLQNGIDGNNNVRTLNRVGKAKNVQPPPPQKSASDCFLIAAGNGGAAKLVCEAFS